MFFKSITKTLESTKKKKKERERRNSLKFINEILNSILVLRIAGIFKDFRNFIFQVKYYKIDSN